LEGSGASSDLNAFSDEWAVFDAFESERVIGAVRTWSARLIYGSLFVDGERAPIAFRLIGALLIATSARRSATSAPPAPAPAAMPPTITVTATAHSTTADAAVDPFVAVTIADSNRGRHQYAHHHALERGGAP
jgi:hypothetical protein